MRRTRIKFPPQGFWLSPRGAVVPVNVHAEALILVPKMFGLARAPRGKKEVNAAMAAVIARGWVRGRMRANGNLWLQMEEADARTIRSVYDFLLWHPGGVASVTVKTERPDHEWPDIGLKDFFDERFPSAWLANPARSGRRR